MQPIELVVFDMAGTTVRDQNEVETCFKAAAEQTNLPATAQRIKDMQGLPKLTVVEILWDEAIGTQHPEFKDKVVQTYQRFKEILENHYLLTEIHPTQGTLETFTWLRQLGIKIALTTGFYRKVTNIILSKLGWDKGLDGLYQNTGPAIIDLSLTPDETGKGRPFPDMIFKAMEMLNVQNPQRVINIGDTPSDLKAGKAANCLLSLAVCNGTHSREALQSFENDGLLDSMADLPQFMDKTLKKLVPA